MPSCNSMQKRLKGKCCFIPILNTHILLNVRRKYVVKNKTHAIGVCSIIMRKLHPFLVFNLFWNQAIQSIVRNSEIANSKSSFVEETWLYLYADVQLWITACGIKHNYVGVYPLGGYKPTQTLASTKLVWVCSVKAFIEFNYFFKIVEQ